MIDLKQDYIEMAKHRITEGETGIPVPKQLAGERGLFERGLFES